MAGTASGLMGPRVGFIAADHSHCFRVFSKCGPRKKDHPKASERLKFWGRHMEPIVFELRDIDADVVRAWEKYFQGIANVRISHGDIFEKPADAIVSPANSFGYMDGGIDLVYLRRFGWELQTRLQAHLRDEHDGELPVGQATIVETFDTAIPYLDDRFLGLNHIRRPRQACRTKCG